MKLFIFLFLFSSTLSQLRTPTTCTTTSGKSCIFPFTLDEVEYYECTYAKSSTPWCATAVDSQGAVITNRLVKGKVFNLKGTLPDGEIAT